jgi:glycosyltransferase involved in cell wall biosynthesis
MNLKRVVFVTSFYPFFGKEVWLKDELAAMGVSGCRPVIIPRRYEQEPERYKINADHEVLNVKMISISIILNTIFNFLRVFSVQNIRDIHRQSQGLADVLKRLSVLPKAYYLIKLLRKSSISHVHCYSTTTVATIGLILSRELGVPFSFTLHTSSQLTDSCKFSYQEIISRSQFIRTISHKTKQDLIAFFPNLAMDITCVHLGLVQNKRGKDSNFVNQTPLTITMACVLEPYKDVVTAISVIDLLKVEFPAVSLQIYGDGSEKLKLEKLTKERTLSSNIKFMGSVPRDELLTVLESRKGGILLLTSNSKGGTEEGIPVIAMEAMRSGIITIATRNGGIQELIQENVNGFIVEQEDVAGIAEKVSEVLSSSISEREMMGLKAQITVAEKFNSEINAKVFVRKLLSFKYAS